MLVRAVTILSLHAAALVMMAASYHDADTHAVPQLRAGSSEIASVVGELRTQPL